MSNVPRSTFPESDYINIKQASKTLLEHKTKIPSALGGQMFLYNREAMSMNNIGKDSNREIH